MKKKEMIYRVWFCPESGIMDYVDFVSFEIAYASYQSEVDRSERLGLSLPSFLGPIPEGSPAI